jgi:hypothetical protein
VLIGDVCERDDGHEHKQMTTTTCKNDQEKGVTQTEGSELGSDLSFEDLVPRVPVEKTKKRMTQNDKRTTLGQTDRNPFIFCTEPFCITSL